MSTKKFYGKNNLVKLVVMNTDQTLAEIRALSSESEDEFGSAIHRLRTGREHLTTRNPGQPRWSLSKEKRDMCHPGHKMFFAESGIILFWSKWEWVLQWPMFPPKCDPTAWIVDPFPGDEIELEKYDHEKELREYLALP